MNILIIGGGELGIMIAGHLINENHSVTLLEKSEELASKLAEQLDGLILPGSGVDVNVLLKANVEKTDLFIALTNDDNVNILSCCMVKRLSHYRAQTIAKTENFFRYFSNPLIHHADFGIDNIIAPKQLSISKLSRLIAEPDTVENINFHDNDIKIVGIDIRENSSISGKSIKEIAFSDKTWSKIRLIAITENGSIIIPKGDCVIKKGSRVFLAGNSETLKDITDRYFTSGIKIKNIIIIGGSKVGRELAKVQAKAGNKVIIIEENEKLCKNISDEFDNILVVHGTGTNRSVLSEIDMKNSYVICVTDKDEQNIISAVMAKKNGAFKAVANIRNIAITPIISGISDIDYVFSTESLALAEILNYCRKGDILSVYPIPELKAQTMKIKITGEIDIIDTPLKNIKFPEGMMIGAIIRGEKVIIPHGNDDVRFNDLVILFLLPSCVEKAKKMFSQSKSK